jgi:hypothetical protein
VTVLAATLPRRHHLTKSLDPNRVYIAGFPPSSFLLLSLALDPRI